MQKLILRGHDKRVEGMILPRTYRLAALFILCITTLSAQYMNDNSRSDKYLAIAENYKSAIAPDAKDYNLAYSLKDKINDDVVYIYRFESGNATALNLYRAHITVIVDRTNKLKGFARTDENMSGKNNLDDDKCRQLALAFIKRYAPDLTDIKFQWVDIHKESVTDQNKKKTEIQGKWVKYKDSKSGHYLWVILAPDGRIMEFDRDIVWSFFRGGRVNELWLRDDWLDKRISKK